MELPDPGPLLWWFPPVHPELLPQTLFLMGSERNGINLSKEILSGRDARIAHQSWLI